jgi:hypothetical protein
MHLTRITVEMVAMEPHFGTEPEHPRHTVVVAADPHTSLAAAHRAVELAEVELADRALLMVLRGQ